MLTQASRRRAKIKLLAKKSIETGEDCDAIPDSYRQYLANQAMESGKPLARGFVNRTGGPMSAYGNGGIFVGTEQNNHQKVGECFVPTTDTAWCISNMLKSYTTFNVDP